MFRVILMLLATGPLSPASAQAEFGPGARVAFLGITFIDTSTEGAYFGAKPAEQARIALLQDKVRDRFAQEGLMLVDLAPVADRLASTVNPAKCYGCDIRMGRTLGADFVLVGEVQKVSNLILSMNLVLRDTETERMVRGLSVDIRSNTDDSWLRGIRYILNNNIFKE
ncbi:DUF3280 domain-containing protein [Actibacterium ureilyticum]|uniref:DUF3280 domain-containing protein n=1 Tax=Actibacterium ureilyticum TaxID=1590614 RepID=UPI000BAAD416|nr:DUF3280 domain-containing protein [Actibacterium ureilyticum]